MGQRVMQFFIINRLEVRGDEKKKKAKLKCKRNVERRGECACMCAAIGIDLVVLVNACNWFCLVVRFGWTYLVFTIYTTRYKMTQWRITFFFWSLPWHTVNLLITDFHVMNASSIKFSRRRAISFFSLPSPHIPEMMLSIDAHCGNRKRKRIRQ